jgi:D-alanyl-D-alanine carboxypeptidase/D-alanyl-D-alanine-endopeptidase (penicillin-binding protein 4)
VQACVEVRKVSTGEVLYGVDADRAQIPASTLKLLTGGVALEVLGSDWRFTTSARVTQAPVGGVVNGPLYLVGGGDPLLETPAFAAFEETRRPTYIPGVPRTDFTELARSIKGRGITRIAGPILGDASFFDDQRVNPGWKESYFADKEIAPITGLQANRNLINYEGGPDALGFAADPATNAADLLKQLLIGQGVAVDGGAGPGLAPEGATEVGVVNGATLSQVVQHLELASDNYVAENMLKTLGRIKGGEGSFAGGAKVVADTLANRGVAVKGLVMTDGSGLARSDQTSCSLLTDLLAHAQSGNGLGDLTSHLAIAGETGTMKLRFPKETFPTLTGKVRAKTGSLDRVLNIAGLARVADGSDVAFAILITGDDGDIALDIQASLLQALIRFPAAAIQPAGIG